MEGVDLTCAVSSKTTDGCCCVKRRNDPSDYLGAVRSHFTLYPAVLQVHLSYKFDALDTLIRENTLGARVCGGNAEQFHREEREYKGGGICKFRVKGRGTVRWDSRASNLGVSEIRYGLQWHLVCLKSGSLSMDLPCNMYLGVAMLVATSFRASR